MMNATQSQPLFADRCQCSDNTNAKGNHMDEDDRMGLYLLTRGEQGKDTDLVS
jgi:hypothetical protein